jgi:hypothetical protein
MIFTDYKIQQEIESNRQLLKANESKDVKSTMVTKYKKNCTGAIYVFATPNKHVENMKN